MDEARDEAFRNIAAAVTAQGFIVEVLLTQYLKTFPVEIRGEIVDTIIMAGARIDPTIRVNTDQQAELFADVSVRVAGAVEDLAHRALARIAPGT